MQTWLRHNRTSQIGRSSGFRHEYLLPRGGSRKPFESPKLPMGPASFSALKSI